jgi:hypothetical protein
MMQHTLRNWRISRALVTQKVAAECFSAELFSRDDHEFMIFPERPENQHRFVHRGEIWVVGGCIHREAGDWLAVIYRAAQAEQASGNLIDRSS